MKIIGRSMFNGGFMWEREPGMMRNYIIIVGWESGSVIMWTQNNELKFFLSLFFFWLEATINSNISINVAMQLRQKLILMQLTIIIVHCNCRSNFLWRWSRNVSEILWFLSRFSLFFKWDCVHSLKRILMFILFINIPMCQTFVNMDIVCFKMSS